MDADAGRFTIDELLKDAGWTRGLAGALVRDESEAEDVLQQTLAVALENPPRDDRPARPWLATVARNFARKRRREEARRHAREAAVARPEAGGVPTPEELAMRLETQRALARHVSALDEPFRATVILRFWEGLSSAEIARRTGVPAGTVRWRLKKALDTLRGRLDGDHGDRRTWALLLLPIIETPRKTATAASAGAAAAGILGGVLTVKKLVLAAAAAVLFLSAGLWLSGAFDAVPTAAEPPRPDAPAPGVGNLPGTTVAGETAGDPDPAVAATGSSDPDAETGAVAARILDPDGAPIAGAELRHGYQSAARVAQSDDRGNVRLDIPLAKEERGFTLQAFAPGRERVEIEVVARRGAVTELGEIVLRPGGVVTGRVLGPDGEPAAGARVVLEAPEGPLDIVLSTKVLGPTDRFRDGETASDGTFRVDGLPAGSYRAWAGRRGMRWAVSGVIGVRAGGTANGVELRLEPLAPEESVSGVVRDPEGVPVARARVRYRIRYESNDSDGYTTTDDEGRFTMLTPNVRSIDFSAVHPAGRYGEARLDGYVPGGGEVVLTLRRAKLGRIRATDADGEPLAEFSFLFLDPKTLVVIGDASGRDGMAEVAFPSRPFRLQVRADGHETKRLGPFDAPEEIRVTLPRIAGITGRVVVGGEPVAGARVEAQLVTRPGHNLVVNGFRSLRISGADETTTEADGTFRLSPSLAGKMILRVEAEGYAPTESEAFEYVAGRGIRDVVVTPVRGGTIEGRVVATGGSPAGAIVAISRGDGEPRTIRVGEDGAFRFENLTPGPWLVTLTDEEIDPDVRSSVAGFGMPEPIPFNCEVRSGGTTTVELPLDLREAEVVGRFLLDGRVPEGWTASLTEEDGGLVSLAKAELGDDGSFRLAQPRGRYRLILAERGRTHEARLVVTQVELAGTVPFELDLATGPFEADAREGDEILYHRFLTPDGVLVLTPLPAGGGTVRLPAGRGEIVRFDVSIWAQPLRWPVVREVDVR